MNSRVKDVSACHLCADGFLHFSLGVLTSSARCPASKASSSASPLPSAPPPSFLLPNVPPSAHLHVLPQSPPAVAPAPGAAAALGVGAAAWATAGAAGPTATDPRAQVAVVVAVVSTLGAPVAATSLRALAAALGAAADLAHKDLGLAELESKC